MLIEYGALLYRKLPKITILHEAVKIIVVLWNCAIKIILFKELVSSSHWNRIFKKDSYLWGPIEHWILVNEDKFNLEAIQRSIVSEAWLKI